jgi:hypothetical protein
MFCLTVAHGMKSFHRVAKGDSKMEKEFRRWKAKWLECGRTRGFYGEKEETTVPDCSRSSFQKVLTSDSRRIGNQRLAKENVNTQAFKIFELKSIKPSACRG